MNPYLHTAFIAVLQVLGMVSVLAAVNMPPLEDWSDNQRLGVVAGGLLLIIVIGDYASHLLWCH